MTLKILKALAGLFLLGSALAQESPPAEAAVLKHGWEILHTLRRGERIRVVTSAGRKIKGRFANLSDQTITVLVKDQERTVSRGDVARVDVRRSKSKRGRDVAIAAAVVAGVGLGLGFATLIAMGGSDKAGTFVAVPAALGAAAGAALGWFGSQRYRVIYTR